MSQVNEWVIISGDEEMQFLGCYHMMNGSHRIFAELVIAPKIPRELPSKIGQTCRIELVSLTRVGRYTHEFRGKMHAPQFHDEVSGMYSTRYDISGGLSRNRGWIKVAKRCPNCHVFLRPKFKFCPECGLNL